MKRNQEKRPGLPARIVGSLLSAMALLVISQGMCLAQSNSVSQTAAVDNTKMGPYRALAQLSFQAFQKGDHATAAELARILERTWDAAEGGGGERSLGKTNKDLFDQADKAMDLFIKPIMNYAVKAPDPASVQQAYNNFLEKLRQAD